MNGNRRDAGLIRRFWLAALCAALLVGGCQCEDNAGDHWALGESDGGHDALLADVIDSGAPPPVACNGELPERSRLTPEAGDTDRARLVVDEQGCPHVAYFQQLEGEGVPYNTFEVKYTRWQGDQWHVEVVATTTAMDWLVDLALDEAGQPTVVYGADDRSTLWFARRDDDGSWQSEQIDRLSAIGHLRYARDPAGRPAILLTHGQRGALSYIERRGDEWVRQEIMTTSSPRELRSRPVFDADGHPHVALAVSGGEHAVYYAHRRHAPEDADAEWVVERVEHAASTINAGLILDEDDRPHIVACRYQGTPSVTHRWRTSSGWQQEAIESTQTQSYGCGALAFDRRGRLHALYGIEDDADFMSLEHATRTADGWSVESLGEFGRIDIELVIDQERGIAHALGMQPLSEERPAMHLRGATYLSFPVD